MVLTGHFQINYPKRLWLENGDFLNWLVNEICPTYLDKQKAQIIQNFWNGFVKSQMTGISSDEKAMANDAFHIQISQGDNLEKSLMLLIDGLFCDVSDDERDAGFKFSNSQIRTI